jgi:hypothetical protein
LVHIIVRRIHIENIYIVVEYQTYFVQGIKTGENVRFIKHLSSVLILKIITVQLCHTYNHWWKIFYFLLIFVFEQSAHFKTSLTIISIWLVSLKNGIWHLRWLPILKLDIHSIYDYPDMPMVASRWAKNN